MSCCLSEHEILDGVASQYNSRRDFDHYLIEFGAELILKDFSGHRMLEVGCSSGVMTRIFATHVPELHVVDGSETYIAALRKELGSQVRCFTNLAEEFSPSTNFDGVVMASLLEHVEDPAAVLMRSRQWLKANGSLFVIVPNRNSIHRQIGVKMGILERLDSLSDRDRMLNHRRIYDLALLDNHLQQAGYQIRDRKGIMIKPLSNAQMESWSPELIRALLDVGLDKPDIAAQIYLRCTH
jgi:2-polyprenyl-3-methyl-5-hydroxy-6-metoxy-1,4-benzoquinol methylase